jgi:hypothetical protein
VILPNIKTITLKLWCRVKGNKIFPAAVGRPNSKYPQLLSGDAIIDKNYPVIFIILDNPYSI